MHSRTSVIREAACLAGLLMLLLVSQAAADASWNYNAVSDPDLHGINDALSGDYLVYSGSTGNPMSPDSQRVIQLYSLPEGNQTRIATSEPGGILTGVGIDGNYVVWFSTQPIESTADIPNRIYLYSIGGKNQTPIRTATGAGWAKISGDHVVWSESVNDSFESSLFLYDIGNGTTSPIPGISTNNGAGVAFYDNNILYSDAKTPRLLLYSTTSGTTTTVFSPPADNNTREIAFEYALGGDYVLYRKDLVIEAPMEHYSELCLYSISTRKTTLISPLTGNVIGTPSPADKAVFFTPQAADRSRVAWVVTDGLRDEKIMVLDPSDMTISSVSPKTFVNSVSLDGRNMSWLGTATIGGKGSIYLAAESGSPGSPAPMPTRVPGPGLLVIAGGLLGGLFIARNMHKDAAPVTDEVE
jgi:hypothetical protein